MRIAHVSTFPEMKCGIAFYVSDVIKALPNLQHLKFVLHYGENPTAIYAAGANVNDPSELRGLAHSISKSDCDVVSLQHEFGIWGGEHGESLLPFLEGLTIPVVSTLHTTFAAGTQPEIRAKLLRSLVRHSVITFVMSARSKNAVRTLFDSPRDEVRVISHGIPDLPFVPPRHEDGSTGGVPHFVSFGFLHPAKGLEFALQAVRMLRDEGHWCRYTISGSTQPQFPWRERYFEKIAAMINAQDLGQSVVLDHRFLGRGEQIELIRSADAAVFAYQHPQYASSGAAALALGTGRPIVCTPFEFAEAMTQEIAAIRMARDFGATALADALGQFLRERPNWTALAKSAYDATRTWTWPFVARAYAEAFAEAVQWQRLRC